MERVTVEALGQQVPWGLFAARKRACSESHDVFPYRDTVTTRLLQISDCRGGGSYDKRNGNTPSG